MIKQIQKHDAQVNAISNITIGPTIPIVGDGPFETPPKDE